jgi:hypothetical protein
MKALKEISWFICEGHIIAIDEYFSLKREGIFLRSRHDLTPISR